MSQHPPAGVEVGDSYFETLLEFAPDAMVGVDRQGVVVLANSRPEAVFRSGRAPRGDP
jgi:hypothetical protein